MRQYDDVECAARALAAMNASDCVFELRDPNELLRRQRPHRNHQPRLENRDLAIEVLAATRDLIVIRNAIAAALRILSWKTADYRGDVNALAKRLLIDAQLRHPTEEPPAGGVGERLPRIAFVRSGRLTDEHHARACHRAHDRPAEDIRAGRTCGQQSYMPSKSSVLYHRVRR